MTVVCFRLSVPAFSLSFKTFPFEINLMSNDSLFNNSPIYSLYCKTVLFESNANSNTS